VPSVRLRSRKNAVHMSKRPRLRENEGLDVRMTMRALGPYSRAYRVDARRGKTFVCFLPTVSQSALASALLAAIASSAGRLVSLWAARGHACAIALRRRRATVREAAESPFLGVLNHRRPADSVAHQRRRRAIHTFEFPGPAAVPGRSALWNVDPWAVFPIALFGLMCAAGENAVARTGGPPERS
jgi:hypothetical protein